MKRAGHMMMVHKENVYVVGGYTYEHHRLKKLFLLDEVIEAAGVTKDIIISRKIVITNLTGKKHSKHLWIFLHKQCKLYVLLCGS